MEIYQLKYFVEVAKSQNMNQVTREFGVSTPALSKAIQLLESELGIKLFDRIGKRIQLTQAGGAFLMRATSILDLVQASTLDLAIPPSTLNLSLAGREIFLEQIGLPFVESLRKKYHNVQARLIPCTGEEAIQYARNGTYDFAFSTQEPPAVFSKKVVLEFEMKTWTSGKHPLLKSIKKGQSVMIEEVLKHSFVAPNTALFGGSPLESSFDGWREDVHPRKIDFITPNLQLFTELTRSGQCLSYLPDFYGKKRGFEQLNISGCKFKCRHKVYISTAKHEQLSWIANAISSFKM